MKAISCVYIVKLLRVMDKHFQQNYQHTVIVLQKIKAIMRQEVAYIPCYENSSATFTCLQLSVQMKLNRVFKIIY